MGLLSVLMPRERQFFTLFNSHAGLVVEGANTLVEMLAGYADGGRRDEYVAKIHAIEHAADDVTHETVALMHNTFVTPFDRDQINKLIQRMDDILDLIQDTAESLMLYDVHQLTPEVLHLADIVQVCCTRVSAAVTQLSSMDNAPAILKVCQEIDALESTADRVMRGAISKLFREEQDVRQLVKLKAVYELLELTTDKCQDVALVIEGVVLENGLTMDGNAVTLTLVFLIVVALAFDFMNGFHDAANSIATIVSTGVLKPYQAVMWAAFFNFVAILLFELKVAATVGKGIVDPGVVDNYVIFGALIGAIAWNAITWYYGLPSSSSHALIGGMLGATIVKAGTDPLLAPGIIKTSSFIVVAPLLGMILSGIVMIAVSWICRRRTQRVTDRWFRRLQLLSSAMYSIGHGSNDAQKTMGIIWLLLIAAGATTADHLPRWVVVSCFVAIALGTLFGGWRIVKTMGQRITKLKPVGGFAAETGGAMSLFLATYFGIPVSTTHTITGSIIGVGATRRVRAVHWGVAGNVVVAWILTIPASALMAAGAWWLGRQLF